MSKFTAAVARAKKLYRTGKYKTFGAAVKAAYHKTPAAKRKTKSSRKVRRHHTVKRRAAPKRRTVARRSRQPKKSLGSKYKASLKKQMANALLSYELATTVKATKAAQKRKVALRKRLKAL